MGNNEYQFLTSWQVHGTPDEVIDILDDAEDLPRWWPSVYIDARVVEAGEPSGVGRLVDLWTKGWLPYTLRWRFRVTESDPPRGFSLDAEGDFVGRGIWTFHPLAGADADGGTLTRVDYDWRVRADKGILRRTSALLRPAFAANHRWAMAQGERSIRLELARRHAAGDAAILDMLPDPPGPTFGWVRGRR